MDRKTYEALKRIISAVNRNSVYKEDMKQINDWIEKVAKKYEK